MHGNRKGVYEVTRLISFEQSRNNSSYNFAFLCPTPKGSHVEGLVLSVAVFRGMASGGLWILTALIS